MIAPVLGSRSSTELLSKVAIRLSVSFLRKLLLLLKDLLSAVTIGSDIKKLEARCEIRLI